MVKSAQSLRLHVLSPLDGRNSEKVTEASFYFSEFALIKYRLRLEIEYLIFLSEKTDLLRDFNPQEIQLLKSLWEIFDEEDALKIKEIEKTINHDVKAVEYFLKEKLQESSLKDVVEFIHFGLTSYDINIPAYALMLTDFREKILVPRINLLTDKLKDLTRQTANMAMLGKTHGQPAVPTTMGKELGVYVARLTAEREILESTVIEAKLTGAVGSFNAHVFASPDIDWLKFSENFISSLHLQPNLITTQILPYDSWLRFFDSIKRINNILLGLCQDIWWYISFDYFLQKKKEEEVGSSTMAHKINPITFENAEGNFGLANSLFEYFVRKLSYSRLQRDLSDSTVKRNFGLAFGFTLLAYDSLLNGLARITPNRDKMEKDLNKHWEIFSEGIQTYLRLHDIPKAYEIMKQKTRGTNLSKEELHALIDSLPIAEDDKKALKINSLRKYLGLSEKIAQLSLEK